MLDLISSSLTHVGKRDLQRFIEGLAENWLNYPKLSSVLYCPAIAVGVVVTWAFAREFRKTRQGSLLATADRVSHWFHVESIKTYCQCKSSLNSMFCGDETAALVGDLGSCSFKFGFGGEDMPKGLIPSCVGRGSDSPAIAGENSLLHKCDDTEIVWARDNGKVNDWEVVVKLWEYALSNVLSSDPADHPLLASCATYESHADRCKLTEVLFEKLNPPAFFLARNAILSSFSLGRASSLVVDIGGPRSCVSPVHDGFVMKKSIRSSRIAGDFIDKHLLEKIEEHLLNPTLPQPQKPQPQEETPATSSSSSSSTSTSTAIVPSENAAATNGMDKAANDTAHVPPKNTPLIVLPCMEARRKRTNGEKIEKGILKTKEELNRIKPSYLKWQKSALLKDFKANVCRVWSELNFDKATAVLYVQERYELPDGTVVMAGAERFQSTELLLHPETDAEYMKNEHKDWSDEADKTPAIGLPIIMRDSLQSLHVDLRRDMCQQIILVGGGSVLPGTVERLTKELLQILPSSLKAKFLTPGQHERLFSTFTGGSIFASLGSAQQLWVSRQQYAENGPDRIVEQHFVH